MRHAAGHSQFAADIPLEKEGGAEECSTATSEMGGVPKPLALLRFLIFCLINQLILFDPWHHVSQFRADSFDLMS